MNNGKRGHRPLQLAPSQSLAKRARATPGQVIEGGFNEAPAGRDRSAWSGPGRGTGPSLAPPPPRSVLGAGATSKSDGELARVRAVMAESETENGRLRSKLATADEDLFDLRTQLLLIETEAAHAQKHAGAQVPSAAVKDIKLQLDFKVGPT